jgi:hypothetical protein
MLMRLKRILIASGLFLLGAGLLVPARYVVVVPEWKILLVDESDKPVSSLHVRQEWISYTYEFWRPPHSEILASDQNGHVNCPERVISVSILADILARVRDFMTLNPHASFGSYSQIKCEDVGLYCMEAYSPSDPVPLKLIVLRKGSRSRD